MSAAEAFLSFCVPFPITVAADYWLGNYWAMLSPMLTMLFLISAGKYIYTHNTLHGLHGHPSSNRRRCVRHRPSLPLWHHSWQPLGCCSGWFMVGVDAVRCVTSTEPHVRVS